MTVECYRLTWFHLLCSVPAAGAAFATLATFFLAALGLTVLARTASSFFTIWVIYFSTFALSLAVNLERPASRFWDNLNSAFTAESSALNAFTLSAAVFTTGEAFFLTTARLVADFFVVAFLVTAFLLTAFFGAACCSSCFLRDPFLCGYFFLSALLFSLFHLLQAQPPQP